MLILTRKSGESITIGDEIRITLLEIKGNKVRIGVEAPRGVPVYREELYRIIREQNLVAAGLDVKKAISISDLWEQLMKSGERNRTET